MRTLPAENWESATSPSVEGYETSSPGNTHRNTKSSRTSSRQSRNSSRSSRNSGLYVEDGASAGGRAGRKTCAQSDEDEVQEVEKSSRAGNSTEVPVPPPRRTTRASRNSGSLSRDSTAAGTTADRTSKAVDNVEELPRIGRSAHRRAPVRKPACRRAFWNGKRRSEMKELRENQARLHDGGVWWSKRL